MKFWIAIVHPCSTCRQPNSRIWSNRHGNYNLCCWNLLELAFLRCCSNYYYYNCQHNQSPRSDSCYCCYCWYIENHYDLIIYSTVLMTIRYNFCCWPSDLNPNYSILYYDDDGDDQSFEFLHDSCCYLVGMDMANDGWEADHDDDDPGPLDYSGRMMTLATMKVMYYRYRSFEAV